MSETPSLEVQLSEAIRARDLEEVHLLLELEVPPTYHDLEIAIEENIPEAVELLVAKGVPLAEVGRFRQSSILHCIEVHARWEDKKTGRLNDALKVARLLLANGADVNMVAGFSEKLPIQMAVQEFLEVADLLVEHGAEFPDDLFTYARTIAGYQWLEKQGVDVRARDQVGRNILGRALLRGGDLDYVRFLVDEGIELEGVNERHSEKAKTPLENAVYGAGMDALPAIEFLLPLLELSDEDKAALVNVADDPAARSALTKLFGGPPDASPVSPETIMTPQAQASGAGLRKRLAELDDELDDAAPGIAGTIREYLASRLTLAAIERLRDQLVASFEKWSSIQTEETLAAIVFEWDGHTTDPYDSFAMATGFCVCERTGDAVSFASPLFDTSGSFDLSAVLSAFDDMATEIAEAGNAATLNEYMRLQAASFANLALGLAVECPEFTAVRSAPSLAFFVREHDHNPVLAFVVES